MNDESKNDGRDFDGKTERTVSLIQVLMILKRFAAIIIIVTIIAAAIGFVFTKNFVDPVYRASFEVLVNVGGASNDGTNGYINASYMATSQKFTAMIEKVIKSQAFLEPIHDIIKDGGRYDLGENSTYKTLAKMIIVSRGEEVQNLKISVDSTNKDFSVYLLNLIYDRLPEEVDKASKGSTIYTLEIPPEEADQAVRVSPNLVKNTALAAVAGFVLSAGIFVFINILDTRIKSDADAERILEVPVIGRIPSFEGTKGGKHHGKKNQ